MPQQQKVTDPNWGKTQVKITDPAWGSVPVDASKKDPSKIRLRSIPEMVGFPTDPETGNPLPTGMHAPPRGTLPVLVGIASAFIPGGPALRSLAAMVGGGGGEAIDEKIHGEKLDPMKIATEAGMQGGITYLGLPNRGAATVGRKITNAGQKAVSAASMTKSQQLARPIVGFGDMVMDAVKGAPIVGGPVTLNNAGHAIYRAGQKVSQGAAQLPDKIRKALLLIRAISGTNKENE
jgi:hypothetical protein